jgi:proteic killer suppression protein
MIRSFRHRGLKRLFEHDDRSKLRPDLVDKIIRILARLNAAGSIDDMSVPAWAFIVSAAI